MSFSTPVGTLPSLCDFHPRIFSLCKLVNPINLLNYLLLYSSQEGHKLKVHYIKNCGDVDKNVIKVQENSSIILNDDCTILPQMVGEKNTLKYFFHSQILLFLSACFAILDKCL